MNKTNFGNNIEYFRQNGLEGLYEEIQKRNKQILDEVKCNCDHEGGDVPSDIQIITQEEIDELFELDQH